MSEETDLPPTTYEKCCGIRRILLNRAAEVMCYHNWDDAFATKQIRELPEFFRDRWPNYCDVQPAELTSAQCDELGFGSWSKENPMRLIPLWLFPFLAAEIKTQCIDGSTVLKKADMDNDHRFGCLAYGIIPADLAPCAGPGSCDE